MKLRYDMVVCYVVRPDSSGALREILQLRRAPGEYLAGAWGPVRGAIEQGETAGEAALRELGEESGLAPREFFQIDTVDIFYLAATDTIWHCPAFCALIGRDQEVTLSAEHDAHRWIDRGNIDCDVLWPGERAQLAEVCRGILDDGPAKGYLRVSIR